MTSPLGQQNPASSPVVFCVLVNWNGCEDTITCIRSLLLQDYPALHIVVVDNASSDDSLPRLRETFPSALYPTVEFIASERNAGFAAGCNLGIRAALQQRASFVWLLNNDTDAPSGTIHALTVEASLPRPGHLHPSPGITGSVLYSMHEPTATLVWGGGNVQRWLGYATHKRSPFSLGPNSFLTFASVLIRCELFLDIGLLDESFFMYFEDSDFCFRARDAGWPLAVAGETAILHREGASSPNSPAKQRTVTSSGLRFLQHHGRPARLSLGLYVVSRLAKCVLRADLTGMRAILLGFADWRQTHAGTRSDYRPERT